MTRGRSGRRAKRSSGWLSSARKPSKRRAMPIWQWIVGIPVIVVLFAGILLFVYVAWFHPGGASSRTLTVLVLDRIEKLDPNGRLDTTASYLEVNVEGARFKVAPRLPDWNRIAKGDLIDIEATGSGPTLAVLSWRAAAKTATPPATAPR